MIVVLSLFLACTGPSPESTPGTDAAGDAHGAAPTATPTSTDPAAQAPAGDDTSWKPAAEALADTSASADQLNTWGYRAYKAGKYDEAAQLFAEAVRRDDNHALAHYNLACTLAILRTQGKVCEYDAYPDTIVGHLERAVALDPARRDRMKEDPDLEPVRDTVRYQVLAGADLSDGATLERVLQGTRWYGLGQGAYGTLETLDFKADGTLVQRKATVTDAGPVWAEEAQKWSRDGQTINLLIRRSRKPVTLDPKGALKAGDELMYLDQPSECGA